MWLKYVHQAAESTGMGLVEQYQRYLLAHKAQHCPAGRVYGQQGTCAVVVAQIVAQKGVLAGLPDIHAQLSRCQHAAKQLQALKRQGELQHDGRISSCLLPLPR